MAVPIFWRKVIGWFLKTKRPRKQKETQSKSSDLKSIKKICLIVGHTKKAPGARASALYPSQQIHEYEYHLPIAKAVASKYENVIYETRDDGGIWGACKRAGERGADLIIELHFNAYNSKVEGGEILVKDGDKGSRHYAQMLLDISLEKIGNNDRKVKDRRSEERGGNNLVVARSFVPYAMLTELFFGDSEIVLPSTIHEILIEFIDKVFEDGRG